MPLLSLLFGLSLIKSFDTVSTSQPTLDIGTSAYQSPLIQPYNKHTNYTNVATSIIDNYSNDMELMRIPTIYSLPDLNEWIVNETYKQEPFNIDTLYTALYIDTLHNSVTILYDTKATHC